MANTVWYAFGRAGQLFITITALVVVSTSIGVAAWEIHEAHNERADLQRAIQAREKAETQAQDLKSKLKSGESAKKETVKELESTVASLHTVTRDKDASEAALRFLEKTIFSGERPSNFWTGGPRQDTTLRAAIAEASSRLEGEFPDAPLAEAWVRTELGHAYASLGEQDAAIEQFRTALKLREDQLGTDSDLTVVCRNDLARALRAKGRIEEAGRLYERSQSLPQTSS